MERLVTESRYLINPKGRDEREIQSFHRVMVTVNEPGDGKPLIPTSTVDRRYVIMRASDKMRAN